RGSPSADRQKGLTAKGRNEGVEGRGTAQRRGIGGLREGCAGSREWRQGGQGLGTATRLFFWPATAMHAGRVVRVLDEDFLSVGVGSGGSLPAAPGPFEGEAPAGRIVVEGQQQREAAQDHRTPRAEQSIAGSCRLRKHPSSVLAWTISSSVLR